MRASHSLGLLLNAALSGTMHRADASRRIRRAHLSA